jgi:hypothetical protein
MRVSADVTSRSDLGSRNTNETSDVPFQLPDRCGPREM